MSRQIALDTGMPPPYPFSSSPVKFDQYGFQLDSGGWQVPPLALEYGGFVVQECHQALTPIQTSYPAQRSGRVPPTPIVSPTTHIRKLQKRPKTPRAMFPTEPGNPPISERTVGPYHRASNKLGRIHPTENHGRRRHLLLLPTRLSRGPYGLLSCALR